MPNVEAEDSRLEMAEWEFPLERAVMDTETAMDMAVITVDLGSVTAPVTGVPDTLVAVAMSTQVATDMATDTTAAMGETITMATIMIMISQVTQWSRLTRAQESPFEIVPVNR